MHYVYIFSYNTQTEEVKKNPAYHQHWDPSDQGEEKDWGDITALIRSRIGFSVGTVKAEKPLDIHSERVRVLEVISQHYSPCHNHHLEIKHDRQGELETHLKKHPHKKGTSGAQELSMPPVLKSTSLCRRHKDARLEECGSLIPSPTNKIIYKIMKNGCLDPLADLHQMPTHSKTDAESSSHTSDDPPPTITDPLWPPNRIHMVPAASRVLKNRR